MLPKVNISLHAKYPLFLSNFNETWISMTDFRIILRYQVSWKSVQWEQSCSMLTERSKHRHDEGTVAFEILWTCLKDGQWNQMVRTSAWSNRKFSYTRKMITQAIPVIKTAMNHLGVVMSVRYW